MHLSLKTLTFLLEQGVFLPCSWFSVPTSYLDVSRGKLLSPTIPLLLSQTNSSTYFPTKAELELSATVGTCDWCHSSLLHVCLHLLTAVPSSRLWFHWMPVICLNSHLQTDIVGCSWIHARTNLGLPHIRVRLTCIKYRSSFYSPQSFPCRHFLTFLSYSWLTALLTACTCQDVSKVTISHLQKLKKSNSWWFSTAIHTGVHLPRKHMGITHLTLIYLLNTWSDCLYSPFWKKKLAAEMTFPVLSGSLVSPESLSTFREICTLGVLPS